jgi:hypothetical protein
MMSATQQMSVFQQPAKTKKSAGTSALALFA